MPGISFFLSVFTSVSHPTNTPGSRTCCKCWYMVEKNRCLTGIYSLVKWRLPLKVTIILGSTWLKSSFGPASQVHTYEMCDGYKKSLQPLLYLDKEKNSIHLTMPWKLNEIHTRRYTVPSISNCYLPLCEYAFNKNPSERCGHCQK